MTHKREGVVTDHAMVNGGGVYSGGGCRLGISAAIARAGINDR